MSREERSILHYSRKFFLIMPLILQSILFVSLIINVWLLATAHNSDNISTNGVVIGMFTSMGLLYAGIIVVTLINKRWYFNETLTINGQEEDTSEMYYIHNVNQYVFWNNLFASLLMYPLALTWYAYLKSGEKRIIVKKTITRFVAKFSDEVLKRKEVKSVLTKEDLNTLKNVDELFDGEFIDAIDANRYIMQIILKRGITISELLEFIPEDFNKDAFILTY